LGDMCVKLHYVNIPPLGGFVKRKEAFDPC